MRYTTIIDITEFPEIYRNHHVRALYLHLVLTSGYHDNDRDYTRLSIRSMAADTGLTLSATRHALAQLIKYNLVAKTPAGLKVTKWVATIQPTPRRQVKTTQEQADAAAARREQQEQLERKMAMEQENKQRLAAQGQSNFTLYYEQKVREAEQGDKEAAKIVKKRAEQYRLEVERLKQLNKSKKQ